MNEDPDLNQIEMEQKMRALDHFADKTIEKTLKMNKVTKSTLR